MLENEASLPKAMKRACLESFAVLLTCCANVALAQADFRYEVRDETKTTRLNFELGQDFTIKDDGEIDGCPNAARVSFTTRYRIYGVAQPSFSYAEESFDKNVTRAEYQAFRAVYETFLRNVRRQPLNQLDTNPGKLQHGATSPGWIRIDNREIRMSAPRGNPDREDVHALVMGFYDRFAPLVDRKITRRTIEGDFMPSRLVSLAQLLSNPQDFDGKRIRVSGYYHAEHHCSNLTFDPKSRTNPQQGVWIDSPSTYADSKRFDDANDAYVVVEGCFSAGPGGAWGAWPGSIERLTEFKAQYR